jgi:hypothetical protein
VRAAGLDQLADELSAAGQLPPAWDAAFRAVDSDLARFCLTYAYAVASAGFNAYQAARRGWLRGFTGRCGCVGRISSCLGATMQVDGQLDRRGHDRAAVQVDAPGRDLRGAG